MKKVKKIKKAPLALYLDIEVIKEIKKLSTKESCGWSTLGRKIFLMGLDQFKNQIHIGTNFKD